MEISKKQMNLEFYQMMLKPKYGWKFNREKLDPFLIKEFGTADIMNLIYDGETDSFRALAGHEKLKPSFWK